MYKFNGGHNVNYATALNQLNGPRQRQGMNSQSYGMSMQSSQANKVSSRTTSQAIQLSPSPKNDLEAVAKLDAFNVLDVPKDVAENTVAVLANAIDKGADPAQAAQAMKSEAAYTYAACVKYLKEASGQDQKILKEILDIGGPTLKNIKLITTRMLVVSKEARIFAAQNEPDMALKAKSAAMDLSAELAMMEGGFLQMTAQLSSALSDPMLTACYIQIAKAEAQLDFEAMEGSDLKTEKEQVADGTIAPEEAVANAEAGEILEELAENSDPTVVVPLKADEAVKFKKQILPKGTLLGLGLLATLGLGYYFLKD